MYIRMLFEFEDYFVVDGAKNSFDPAADFDSSFEDIPPPAYNEPGTIAISQDGIRTQAQVTGEAFHAGCACCGLMADRG